MNAQALYQMAQENRQAQMAGGQFANAGSPAPWQAPDRCPREAMPECRATAARHPAQLRIHGTVPAVRPEMLENSALPVVSRAR